MSTPALQMSLFRVENLLPLMSLLHHSSLLSPLVKLVWQLGQQHLQLNPGSMLPMLLSARSWGGHAFHLPSRYMVIGVKRLKVCSPA